ncbi:MAG: DUF4097 domain-containing protein [Terriglobia bacterium]
MVKLKALIITSLLAAAPCLAAEPAEQLRVQRGEPQRQGNYWEERADCSAPLREGSRLVIRADFGSVNVTPGASDRMACQVRLRSYTANESEARRFFREYELSIRQLENGIMLKGTLTQGQHGFKSLGAEFNIAAPSRLNLDIETKGGEVSVQKLDGELQAVTAGGDVSAGDVAGPVRVETAGGDIRLGAIGTRLEARTAGGDIRVGDVKGDATVETSGGEIVAGMIHGALRAETAGGDLVLRGASGGIEARTAGGQIQIGQSGGSVIAATAGGSIRLQGARGRVEAKTAGGSIDLLQLRNGVVAATSAGCILAQIDADLKSFSASDLRTSMGDIQVYVPPNLPMTIDAAIDMAAGHKIVTDFPAIKIASDGQSFAPTKVRGEGALNGGGEVLRIRTTGGNIEIRKLDPNTLAQLRARQESYWKRWQAQEERRLQKAQERQKE